MAPCNHVNIFTSLNMYEITTFRIAMLHSELTHRKTTDTTDNVSTGHRYSCYRSNKRLNVQDRVHKCEPRIAEIAAILSNYQLLVTNLSSPEILQLMMRNWTSPIWSNSTTQVHKNWCTTYLQLVIQIEERDQTFMNSLNLTDLWPGLPIFGFVTIPSPLDLCTCAFISHIQYISSFVFSGCQEDALAPLHATAKCRIAGPPFSAFSRHTDL